VRAVQLYSAKAASPEPFGDRHVFVGNLPQFCGRHDMRNRPAVGIRLIGNPLGGGHRTPELLTAGVPELRDEARAFAFDCLRGRLKPSSFSAS
jgi:hypothetical protein